jgi:hypothetical protein
MQSSVHADKQNCGHIKTNGGHSTKKTVTDYPMKTKGSIRLLAKQPVEQHYRAPVRATAQLPQH